MDTSVHVQQATMDERRARGLRWRRLQWAFSVTVFAAAFSPLACGGEGQEAPHTITVDEDVGACPAADSLLDQTQHQLSTGAFDVMRPHLERILVRDGGLRTLLLAVTSTVGALGDTSIDLASAALEGGIDLAPLKPHVIEVLTYFHGTNPHLAGEHMEPVAATHRMLTTCAAADSLAALRDLLVLEVRRGVHGWELAEQGAGEQAWTAALLDALLRANEQPALTEMLRELEVDDEDSNLHIGRDAFLVLARLLAANVSAPDFELGPTRELFDEVLLSQLQDQPEALAIVDEVLDLLSLVVDPDSVVFPNIQLFMACANRQDSEAAIPGMIYDWLSIEELAIDTFLADISGLASLTQAEGFRALAVTLIDAALTHPAIIGDATRVVGAMIEPAVAHDGIGMVLGLEGTGVVSEVTELIGALLTCKNADTP